MLSSLWFALSSIHGAAVVPKGRAKMSKVSREMKQVEKLGRAAAKLVKEMDLDDAVIEAMGEHDDTIESIDGAIAFLALTGESREVGESDDEVMNRAYWAKLAMVRKIAAAVSKAVA